MKTVHQTVKIQTRNDVLGDESGVIRDEEAVIRHLASVIGNKFRVICCLECVIRDRARMICDENRAINHPKLNTTTLDAGAR